MRRIWAYLLAVLLAVCSCVNPLTQQEPDDDGGTYPEGAKVTINFTVAGERLPSTKAQDLGENQALDNLYLAVFGSSGYLKEYVEATPGGPTGEYYSFTSPKDNPTDPDVTIDVPIYSFSAKLTLTDSPRIIHFVGNSPKSTLSFGYADAVLSPLLSSSGKGAFWQMMHIDGIHAKQYEGVASYEDDHGNTVEQGDYIDISGNKIINGEGYVVAPATQAQFGMIPLVRNWAKLVVEADTAIPQGGTEPNDPYFEPISYAIVHVPDRGTIAPHSSATNGFIENYQNKTYNDIVQMNYPANLPPDTQIDESIPDIADFKYWDPEESVYEHGDPAEVLPDGGWRNGVAPANRPGYSKGAVYLYERPVPSDQLPPTFVIIYGKYLPEDTSDPHYGQKCFYKVDLMTEHKYYPIYRNFQYRILIHSILSFGHPTPAAAAAAAGSADVSADINARHLPDISDGFRRLVVQPWMAKTFTSAQTDNDELSVYFDDDISVDGWDTHSGAVTLDLQPMKKNGMDPVILSYSIDPTPGDDGFRKIRFSTSGPSDNIRSQTLRVIGTSGDEALYRDIVITIQDIQYMRVSCSDSRINAEKHSPIDLYIDIPDGLAQSMFPLQFLIEPEAMTLSPNNDNLPVEYGESISGSGKTSFHFIKSLDWDEYNSLSTILDESDKMWRRMTCHFISNRDISATTIYVTNDEYFHPADTRIRNFQDKAFYDVRIEEPIRRNATGQELTLAFSVARGDNNELPEVVLVVDGLIPQDRDNLSLPAGFTQISDNSYRFTPTTSDVRIPAITSDIEGEVYYRVEAANYESQSFETRHFTLFHGIGFIDGHATTNKLSGWSNVVRGRVNQDKNKNVLFGYFDDPNALNPEINLEGLDEKNQLVRKYPETAYPWTPAGPKSADGEPNYHELEFQTANKVSTQEISFVLASPGYLEEPVHAYRFSGTICTYNNYSLKSSNVTGSPLSITCNMDNAKPPSHTSTATFSSEFHADGSGVWLDAGQTGTISFTNSKPSEYKFFYVQFNIGKKNNIADGQRLFPVMDATTSDPVGSFEKYPGNNEQCIWYLPRDAAFTPTLSIQITAGEHPVLITGIVIKTIK